MAKSCNDTIVKTGLPLASKPSHSLYGAVSHALFTAATHTG